MVSQASYRRQSLLPSSPKPLATKGASPPSPFWGTQVNKLWKMLGGHHVLANPTRSIHRFMSQNFVKNNASIISLTSSGRTCGLPELHGFCQVVSGLSVKGSPLPKTSSMWSPSRTPSTRNGAGYERTSSVLTVTPLQSHRSVMKEQGGHLERW